MDVFIAEHLAESSPESEASSADAKANAVDHPLLLVYHAVHGAKKILHYSDGATVAGVRKDMNLVTAEALLQAEDARYSSLARDPSREWIALQELAGIGYEFTPHVSIHNAPSLGQPLGTGEAAAENQREPLHAGLLLEISGSLMLFNGLEGLCAKLREKLEALHYFVQLGLGPSPESAWLLSSHIVEPNNNSGKQDYLQQLAQVELHQLDCFTQAFAQLAKMGLTRLDDVMAIPLVELGRRFGEPFIHYLQALMGQKHSGQIRRAEAREFRPRVQLNYPVTDFQQLQPVVVSLLQQLAAFLRREQLQCEAIEWLLLSASGDQQRISIVCQPVHGDWSLLQQLTYIHFEHTELSFEVDSVELWLNQSSPFLQETGDLFSADPELALDQQEVMRRWQLLLTQLHNRLGDKSTEYLTLESEHWPEQLNHWQPSTLQDNSQHDKNQSGTNNQSEGIPENIDWIEQLDQHLAPRPSWLIDPPEILKQSHHQLFWQGPLKLLLGPERLQGQWWQNEDAQCRDYFIAEHHDYRRLWVYHDHKAQQWFLQGVFG